MKYKNTYLLILLLVLLTIGCSSKTSPAKVVETWIYAWRDHDEDTLLQYTCDQFLEEDKDYILSPPERQGFINDSAKLDLEDWEFTTTFSDEKYARVKIVFSENQEHVELWELELVDDEWKVCHPGFDWVFNQIIDSLGGL